MNLFEQKEWSLIEDYKIIYLGEMKGTGLPYGYGFKVWVSMYEHD